MDLMININNGIKKPTNGYENYNTNQILIFGWLMRVGESLFYLNYHLDQYHSKPYYTLLVPKNTKSSL